MLQVTQHSGEHLDPELLNMERQLLAGTGGDAEVCLGLSIYCLIPTLHHTLYPILYVQYPSTGLVCDRLVTKEFSQVYRKTAIMAIMMVTGSLLNAKKRCSVDTVAALICIHNTME